MTLFQQLNSSLVVAERDGAEVQEVERARAAAGITFLLVQRQALRTRGRAGCIVVLEIRDPAGAKQRPRPYGSRSDAGVSRLRQEQLEPRAPLDQVAAEVPERPERACQSQAEHSAIASLLAPMKRRQHLGDRRVAGVISGAGDYKPGIVLDRQYSFGENPRAL